MAERPAVEETLYDAIKAVAESASNYGSPEQRAAIVLRLAEAYAHVTNANPMTKK